MGDPTYTWARRGQQPQGKTSGTRKGYQVFGLMDSFAGRFVYQGQEGRLNAATYSAFLQRVRGAHDTPHHPHARWGAVSHQRRDHSLLRAADNSTGGLPAATLRQTITPIEKLWKKIKQQDTQLPSLPTFDALTEKIEQALIKFANIPEEILALCSLPTE